MPSKIVSVKDRFSGVERTIDVGGSRAPSSLYPWMASIQLVVENRIDPLCGGTLIARNWVLTAGHCDVSPPSAEEPDVFWRVVIGRSNLLNLTGQVFSVKRTIKPPGFKNDDSFEDDICLIELDRDAAGVAPVRLINPEEADVGIDTELSILGWGNSGIDGYSSVLRQGQAQLRSLEDCRAEYQSSFPEKVFKAEMLCAGLPGEGACERDSGGPVLVEVGGVLKQIAVISFSPRCGRPRGLGVHTRVADYLQWIQQHVEGV